MTMEISRRRFLLCSGGCLSILSCQKGKPAQEPRGFINTIGGKSFLLTANDSLDDLPPSHLPAVSPEIRAVFDDPIGYFRDRANACRFEKMAKWLHQVTESGSWRLSIDEQPANELSGMSQQFRCAFWLSAKQIAGAFLQPPPSNSGKHRFDAIDHFYSIVGSVTWAPVFTYSGGFFGNAQHSTLADNSIVSEVKNFPEEGTYLFGTTSAGDSLVYNLTGHSAVISKNMLNSIEFRHIDGLVDWAFNQLLKNAPP